MTEYKYTPLRDTDKFFSPINKFQQLMAITAEECGELTQVCMKIMRKHDNLIDARNSKFHEKLIEEAGDVLCMLELLVSNGIIKEEDLLERADIKEMKLRKWSTIFDDK